MRHGDFSGVLDAAVWMGVLLTLVGVGVYLVMAIRRRLLRESNRNPVELSLTNLSRLKEAGEVTDAEYAAIRKALVRRLSHPSASPHGGLRSDPVQGFDPS